MPRSRNDYPDNPMVAPMRFKRATLNTMREFKRMRPWRGTEVEKMAKFIWLYEQLNEIYLPDNHVILEFGRMTDNGDSGSSHYRPYEHTVRLQGKFSVITALHEFRHAMGGDEYQAVKWSVNLYRITFPRLFASMQSQGHVIRARRS
tara:strand:- start:107 stop:547 length:441 start_codon:yes stop_codon:yes gene_type:complete